MISKAFFVRDSMTTISAIAIRLLPRDEEQRQVLARAGYGVASEDQGAHVMLFRADGDGANKASTDPFQAHQPGTTMFCAHQWISRHFDAIEDGMHLNVQSFRQAMGNNDFAWLELAEPPLKSAEGA
jgi:putative heme iron utilization protein